MTNDGWGYID